MPDFLSIKSAVNKLKAKPSASSRFGPGVGNQGGDVVIVQGNDHTFRVNLGLRGAQSFFALVTMLIAVYMATFQSKWVGSPSGLTGFILFVSIASFIASLVFLVVPFVYERSGYKTFKTFYRAIQEARVGLVSNATFMMLNLILAVTQTISAYTSPGCKDAARDPHASGDKKDDFIHALPGWCRTKRAEAAFVWFTWVAWLFSLVIFLRQWRIERKQGPRIPPFAHPTDGSAFEPINDVDDDEYGAYDDAVKADAGGYGGAEPPISYDRRGSNPLADIEARYGMNSAAARKDYGGNGGGGGGGVGGYASNPFADSAAAGAGAGAGYAASRPSYDYNAYSGGGGGYGAPDPYSAIQHQLDSAPHANPPPPLPDLGYLPQYR